MKMIKYGTFLFLLLVPNVPIEAKNWYTPADELADQRRVARNDLHSGKLYYEGVDGQAPDYIRAFFFFNRAANQTVDQFVQRRACLMLGQIYYYGGHGMERNTGAAWRYFNELVGLDAGTPDDIPFNQRLLFATAYYYLAKIEFEGSEEIAQNWSHAQASLELALLTSFDTALQFDAYVLLGKMFVLGHETLPQNVLQAANSMVQADIILQTSPDSFSAEQKADFCMVWGDIAKNGISGVVESNYVRAFSWYVNAYTVLQDTTHELRFKAALSAAGLLLRGGHGLSRNENQALFYLKIVDGQDLYPELQRRARDASCTVYFSQGEALLPLAASNERDFQKAIACYTYVSQYEQDDYRRALSFLRLGDLYAAREDRLQARDCYIQVLELLVNESDGDVYQDAYQKVLSLVEHASLTPSEVISEQEDSSARESGDEQAGDREMAATSEQAPEQEPLNALASLHVDGQKDNQEHTADEHH